MADQPPAFRPAVDDTNDPALRSWVESANDPATDFPIQNLPFCCFAQSHDGHTHEHLGVAIGDQVLDLTTLAESDAFVEDTDSTREETIDDAVESLLEADAAFILASPDVATWIRRRAQAFLRHDAPLGGQQSRRLRQKALMPIAEATFLPFHQPHGYTDFYASIHHATTVGSMFRPDQPLLPNYKHVPIGYHGRASSIIISDSPVYRPRGQQAPPEADPKAPPAFGPCKMLDYELEVGVVVGGFNDLGEATPITEAAKRIFGLCLVNDWSARDIQKWEYQPLGPFLAKNFATTISPFVVTMQALEPFRCPATPRPDGDPRPLPYLWSDEDQALGAFEITLEVWLESEVMRKKAIPPIRISRGGFRDMYWTFAQMLTHHTSNGCNLLPGDLIASGTVSGPESDSRGCLLELTWDGLGTDGKPKPRKPISLPTGETRTFLTDGDTVIFRGFCEKPGFRRVGFGECRGTIRPPR